MENETIMESETNSDVELYVPIDRSDSYKLIPPGEDIIYSSMAKQVWAPGNARITVESHFLATKKGFVMDFAYDIKRKKWFSEVRYIPWYEINFITRRAGKVMPPLLHFTKAFNTVRFYREKAYESKERYAERSKNVLRTFIPFILESKKERLAFLQAHQGDKDIYKKKDVKKLMKTINMFEKFQKKFCKN